MLLVPAGYHSTASRSELSAMREKLESLQQELEDSQSTIIKLRAVVSKLKEDRTHYRSLAEKAKQVSNTRNQFCCFNQIGRPFGAQ